MLCLRETSGVFILIKILINRSNRNTRTNRNDRYIIYASSYRYITYVRSSRSSIYASLARSDRSDISTRLTKIKAQHCATVYYGLRTNNFLP